MTTTQNSYLIEFYVDTFINLLSHILYGIKNQTSNIDDKLKEINQISEKIKEKEFKDITNFKEKINKLNEIITDIKDGDENGFKKYFTTIMT
jgi:hypothetical protein